MLKTTPVIILVVGLVVSTQAGILSKSLVQSFLSGGDTKDVIVEFPSMIDSVISNSQLSGLSGSDRTNMIVSLMQLQTKASQAPIISALTSLGISEDQIQPFWVDNKFAIKNAPLGPLQALAAIPGPFTVREPFQVKIFPNVAVDEEFNNRFVRQSANNTPQWGVDKINAPTVWAKGFTGQNIVVAVIDTGVSIRNISFYTQIKDVYAK
jgi:subtilisin family serine protease